FRGGLRGGLGRHDAVEGLERCGELGASTACGELVRPSGGSVREDAGQMPHGLLDPAVLVAAGPCPLDLGFHEGEDVRPEGDDGGGDALPVADDVEGVRCLAYDRPGGIRRLELFEWRVQADRLEV